MNVLHIQLDYIKKYAKIKDEERISGRKNNEDIQKSAASD